jgi:hypothetical protein
MEKVKNVCEILVGEPEEKRPLGRPKRPFLQKLCWLFQGFH